MSARCTCGETACESELCDCDKTSCPVDHAFKAEVIAEYMASFAMTEAREIAARHRAEVLREAAEKIRRHDWSAHTVGERCCDDLTDEAADLIDPDKED